MLGFSNFPKVITPLAWAESFHNPLDGFVSHGIGEDQAARNWNRFEVRSK
jgi:hypothetical protein